MRRLGISAFSTASPSGATTFSMIFQPPVRPVQTGPDSSMVKLIVTARIVPESSYLEYIDHAEDFRDTLPRTKKLREEKTLVTNVDKPREWNIGDLANEFAQLYRQIYKR